jgi:hypothetical protein
MSKVLSLKGEWKNIILVNYKFDPVVLVKYLPPDTELNTFNGEHYLSLVGSLYKDTRVKGVIVPFQRTFEEINMRFYIRQKADDIRWKRGIALVKEIVPKKLTVSVANKIFGDNHEACETRHILSNPMDGKLSIEYMWKHSADWNWMVATADYLSHYPALDSEEHFISEHFSGYFKDKDGSTNEYNIERPSWRMHKVRHHEVHCNFEKEYGQDFAILNSIKPSSVFLAEGSQIQVTHKKKASLVALS